VSVRSAGVRSRVGRLLSSGRFRSTTPNTVIEIGTSTLSASKRPGVRPRRASSESRSCCLHVGNYAGFRVSRHSSFSVFSCGVTEIVVFHHGVVTS
jgi:hypothetical protein